MSLLWLALCAFAAADPPALALELNLPAYRLDLLQDGERVRSYAVAIGTRSHPTPTGSFTVGTVEWNPWWHPPDSDWARERQVTPPGPANPMGRAKLSFLPLYFVHGTPEAASIGSAASHGCVRMRNADVVDLALRLTGQPAGAPAPRATRTVRLAPPVPLTIVYRRVEVRDGQIELHPDPYRRGGDLAEEVRAVVRRYGLLNPPPEALDAALAELARGRGSVRIPLQQEAP